MDALEETKEDEEEEIRGGDSGGGDGGMSTGRRWSACSRRKGRVDEKGIRKEKGEKNEMKKDQVEKEVNDARRGMEEGNV